MILTNELIAKLEAATEGRREIDDKIMAVVNGLCVPHIETDGDEWFEVLESPLYTTSLDAALPLVPAGRLWSIGAIVNGSGFVAILNNDGQSHRGTTPALAICIAALKARQIMEKSS